MLHKMQAVEWPHLKLNKMIPCWYFFFSYYTHTRCPIQYDHNKKEKENIFMKILGFCTNPGFMLVSWCWCCVNYCEKKERERESTHTDNIIFVL